VRGLAKFSDDKDRMYRYVLGRIWDPEGLPLVWIMLNPSIASASKNDQTIHQCIHFSRELGYGGLWVVNLFALRSSSPDMLHIMKDPVGPDNDKWINWAVSQSTQPVVAWGRNARHWPERTNYVLEYLRRIRMPLRCLGLTKDGYPKHPCRISRITKFEIYPNERI
jgi:hypothetical protein